MPQVDNRSQEEPLVTAEQAVALCDRNFGIGGDGVRCRATSVCTPASLFMSSDLESLSQTSSVIAC